MPNTDITHTHDKLPISESRQKFCVAAGNLVSYNLMSKQAKQNKKKRNSTASDEFLEFQVISDRFRRELESRLDFLGTVEPDRNEIKAPRANEKSLVKIAFN